MVKNAQIFAYIKKKLYLCTRFLERLSTKWSFNEVVFQWNGLSAKRSFIENLQILYK